MIVIERVKLKFLLAGRVLEIEDRDPSRYRRDRTYALGTTHRRSVCRVRVVEVSETTIKVRQAEVDPPRLLARDSTYEHSTLGTGYTDRVDKAMFGEPEAVDPVEIDRSNKRRAAQVAAFQALVGSATDELARGATRADQRRLRTIRHQASALY